VFPPGELCAFEAGLLHSYGVVDELFGLEVATASGVTLMVETIERLRPHAQLYRLHYTVGIADDTVREHQRVLDAVARGDDAGAAQAMSAHLVHGWPARPAVHE
jgi:DNA-binding GntR family transcriptional regulator